MINIMKGINWKDHLINLLVVIVGITAAFYLESWKENSSAKNLERKYLKNLYEDLRQDYAYMDTLMRNNKEQLKTLKILSSASVYQPYNKDSLVYYIRSIQYSRPFTPQNTTYESMKFSGKWKSSATLSSETGWCISTSNITVVLSNMMRQCPDIS